MPNVKTGAKSPTLPDTFRLKITYRKVDDLKPYAGNARTHTDKQIAQIATSIEQFGFTNPVPPLGYDPHPDPKTRGLVVDSDEAETVRAIYQLYDDLGCLNAVMRKANELGLLSKLHQYKSGRVQGGNPLSRGQIYALLRNPIYIGKIRHKSKIWDGQHDAIIDIQLWDRILDKLQSASARPRSRSGSKNSRTKKTERPPSQASFGTKPVTG